MAIWQAQVRIPDGAGTRLVVTRVMATTTFQARLLLEQQYGQGSVVSGPVQVKD